MSVVCLENYIDGESLFKLSEHDVQEIIQPLGLRKKICGLISTHQEVSC